MKEERRIEVSASTAPFLSWRLALYLRTTATCDKGPQDPLNRWECILDDDDDDDEEEDDDDRVRGNVDDVEEE